jgi:NAD(P)-dependent dehydrogenase (short-subunit alcohol dehydrogenase family)
MQGATNSMAGKTCLVTGATAGIGAVTARELARRSATVVIVGRSRERCDAMVDAIRRETGNTSVESMPADLSSQAEIRRLANAFLERHRRLDVLVNNAGAMFELRRESVDGIEMTFALNHLGYFLLTTLLLEILKASAPSRIIVVSSAAHEDIRAFDFDDPQARARAAWRGAYADSRFRSLLYSLFMPWAHPAFRQYAHTKLANLLFTYELARRLAGTGVTVNALHPGLVATNFAAGTGVYSWFMRRYTRWFAISPEEGAKTTVYLATASELANVSGQYFVKAKPTESSAASRDAAAARRLWELSEQMTSSSRTAFSIGAIHEST